MIVRMVNTVLTLWGPISVTPMGVLARHAILDILSIEQQECAWVSFLCFSFSYTFGVS